MNVQTGVSPTQVLRRAGHVVFVEGSNDDAFDPTVIRELLKANGLRIEVRAIGPCENVIQAAKAMVWKHPTYYFLADRDGRDSAFVERSWNNFPQPDTYNLLFWRKRELENYFIAPEYLERSQLLVKSPDELRERILAEAKRRFYLEAANLVLLRIRSSLLEPAKAWFTQENLFVNRDDALNQLLNSPELHQRAVEIGSILANQERERMLDEVLHLLSGGKPTLEFGSGAWVDLLSGKEIFRSISGNVFRVSDASGKLLQGREQNDEVVKELLRLALNQQPADFQQLVTLMKIKVSAAP